jgi:hypothetical protein
VRRIAELELQGSRFYTEAAAEAADAERRARATTTAAYVRYLERTAAAKAKAARGEDSTRSETGGDDE